jgi:hypothetical protein
VITFADFLDINRSIIYFMYGLVFFILGFAIILQTRRRSRLELARSLRWLAAFGMVHGLYEWGELFIPIQAAYLDLQAVRILELLQLILLAGSYSFLMEFGFALLHLDKRRVWSHWLTAFLFTGWLIVTLSMIPQKSPMSACGDIPQMHLPVISSAFPAGCWRRTGCGDTPCFA